MTAVRPIAEDDLQAYVDGALTETRRDEVEDYLAANPAEAERVAGFRAQRAMLREHFAPTLAEPLPPELSLARMVEERGGSTSVSGWRAAIAACMLLAVGGAAGWFGREAVAPEADGVAVLAQEAAANFAVYAPDRIRPVEVRADESADLTAWMTARLGRAVVPPNLAASGYRLMGGRVVATAHGPAGFYMYDDDRGSRIVLLTKHMDVPHGSASMSEGRSGGVAIWSWAQDGLGYSLAGSIDTTGLHVVADIMRRQAGSKP